MDPIGRPLVCGQHGTHPWAGEIVCAPSAGGCGRVWQTADDEKPLFAPFVCECGQQLMHRPPEGEPHVEGRVVREDWTARAICHACFETYSRELQ